MNGQITCVTDADFGRIWAVLDGAGEIVSTAYVPLFRSEAEALNHVRTERGLK